MQEERQRGKDRSESEVESTSSANEDMPVEKILEAELAVEPKTETYVEANMGLSPSSVSPPWGLPQSPWVLVGASSSLDNQGNRGLLLWAPGPRCGPLSGLPALGLH